MNESNAYLRTKVMTASPAELRLMLLDGAIKFANQAKEGLEAKDYEKSFNGFTSCRNIILELVNGIRPEPDPKLAETVRSLYMFIYSELVQASFDKDSAKLTKMIELIEYERETWAQLMQKLATEEKRHPAIQPAATGTSAAIPAAPPAPGRPANAPGISSLSIQA